MKSDRTLILSSSCFIQVTVGLLKQLYGGILNLSSLPSLMLTLSCFCDIFLSPSMKPLFSWLSVPSGHWLLGKLPTVLVALVGMMLSTQKFIQSFRHSVMTLMSFLCG